MVNTNVVWAAVASLSVGYILGNVLPLHGHSGGNDSITATQTAVPPDWLTDKDMGASDLFLGLTPPQRYLALKVLNTKPCDCGCPHGTIAKCKVDDPACPYAPTEVEIAVREARAGKSFDEIYAAVQHPGVAKGMPGMPGMGGAPNTMPQSAPPTVGHKMPLADWTPIRGPKTAKVTVVEFSDFQCPFCSRVEPVLQQIAQTYGDDVRLAWRHEPLPFHEHAIEAAEASMAADAQGKFWPMHDKMFANQQALDRASLDRYAQDLGLDMTKYKAAMDGHTFLEKIQDDAKVGAAAGATGTPAFFINGQYIFGSQPFGALKAIIDAELVKANALIKKGTSMDKLYQAELDAIPAEADAGAH
jgi:protein-disulfide isomerase